MRRGTRCVYCSFPGGSIICSRAHCRARAGLPPPNGEFILAKIKVKKIDPRVVRVVLKLRAGRDAQLDGKPIQASALDLDGEFPPAHAMAMYAVAMASPEEVAAVRTLLEKNPAIRTTMDLMAPPPDPVAGNG